MKADLERAEQGLAGLQLRAPSAGVVSLLPNYRTGGVMSGGQEFREGDRAWSGAGIVELPDLASVRIAARLEETDRGRVAMGQSATVRVDAVPDREYRAKVADISLLARADFSSGWPPPRDFDVELEVEDADARLKPGMTAAIRVAVERLADALVIPAGAVSLVDGRPTVYRLARIAFRTGRRSDRAARPRAGGRRVGHRSRRSPGRDESLRRTTIVGRALMRGCP